MQYSQELIERFKKEFKEKHGKEYTDEEANEALNNLAGLFLAFSKTPEKSDKCDTTSQ